MTKTVNCAAVDLGASGGKVMLGSYDGAKVALQELYRFPNGPLQVRNSIYWDVQRLFKEVKKGLGLVGKAATLDSIGLDAWGNDFCLLGRDGKLLENPHSYRDPRTDGVMEKAFEVMSRDEIYRRTGVQFMQHNTLFQLYSMVLAGSPLLKPADTCLMTADLFNYWLCGAKCCEFTNATTTQFCDPYKKEWCLPVMEAFAIPVHIMPPIVSPSTRLGLLGDRLLGELSLPAVPVIAVGTHDTASAVSVVPTPDDDYAFLSSGTWSLLGAEVKAPLISQAGMEHNFSCYGGVGGSWLTWKNIQALWLLQECIRAWEESGQPCSLAELIDLAEEAQPFGPLIDVDDRLFLTPGGFPARIAEYCRRTGQGPPTDRGATVRCILESLAFKYRHTFEKLQVVLGRKLSRIHVVGGGSRNSLLNRFTAGATGVTVVAGPAEATALGNFMSQLTALGEVGALSEAREIVRRSFETITYLPADVGAWNEAYGRFSIVAGEAKRSLDSGI
jgi:sugar (pentulose or hexulose) kinase